MRRAILAAIIGLGMLSGNGLAQDDTQITVTGTVEKIEYMYPTPWARNKFMRISVKKENGRTVYAWIPPAWTVDVQVEIGNKIEVQGYSFQYANQGIFVSLIKNLSIGKTYNIGRMFGPYRGSGYRRGPRWQ